MPLSTLLAAFCLLLNVAYLEAEDIIPGSNCGTDTPYTILMRPIMGVESKQCQLTPAGMEYQQASNQPEGNNEPTTLSAK